MLVKEICKSGNNNSTIIEIMVSKSNPDGRDYPQIHIKHVY